VTLYRLDRPPGPCIGVDGGVNGGAALFDGRRWHAREWVKRERVAGTVYVVTEHDGRAFEVSCWARSLDLWLHRLGEAHAHACAVEAAGYQRGKGLGLTTLVDAAGTAVGLLIPYAAGDVERPAPQKWRARVLNLGPRTPAEQASTAAIHAVAGTQDPSRSRMVDLGVGLRLGEHAAEAVCIALWAAGCRLARVDGVA
jgi:hypothetical protein